MKIEISDPYVTSPVCETKRFRLRQVQLKDAEDLLGCYSDPEASLLFNSDNCRSDFRLNTLKDMQNIIGVWLGEYEKRAYIRFSVVDKLAGTTAGTVEFFCRSGVDGDEQSTGVLRLDLASRYETEENLCELISLAGERFREWFEFSGIVTKAVPQAERRIRVLRQEGYHRLELNGSFGYSDYYLKRSN
ncbi:GNAT family N-acetyltransferase [Paenibacillus phytohabitans]|uniref:GNAT family N-acetyltransferase n=1 Tax=Paenibacillus phytohabitans TaxID=2654978 RepID=UPI00300B8068